MGDFYWDSPNRQVSPNVEDMQRNLMTFGGMGTPKLDSHKSQKELLKDFAIRALMLGGIGVGKSPTPNPVGQIPPGMAKTAPEVFPATRPSNIWALPNRDLEVPGNLNTKPEMLNPLGPKPPIGPKTPIDDIIAQIKKDLGVPEGQSLNDFMIKGHSPIQMRNPRSLDPTSILTAEELKHHPGVVRAKSPLGEVQPVQNFTKDPVMKYLLGTNKGKGNFGVSDFDMMKPEANINPGPRHPNVGEPLEGPNRSDALKYQDALDAVKLKKMGLDPDKMTPAEKMRALFPGLDDLLPEK